MLPQNTDLGKAFSIDNSKFREFIIGGDTSYGITTNESIHIITGKTYEEKELPVLKFPYVVDNNIVLDMRNVIRHPEKETLKEMLNVRSDYKYTLLTGLFTDEELNGEIKGHTRFYSKFLQTLITTQLKTQLMLDNDDVKILNNIIAIYAYNICNDVEGHTSIHMALTGVVGDQMNENDIIDLIGDSKLTTLQDVIDVLKNDMVSITLQKLEGDVLHSMIASTVFQSHRLQILLGLRTPVMMLPLIWLYDNERLYQKTRLKNILKNYAKLLDTPKFNNDVKLLTKKTNCFDLIEK